MTKTEAHSYLSTRFEGVDIRRKRYKNIVGSITECWLIGGKFHVLDRHMERDVVREAVLKNCEDFLAGKAPYDVLTLRR